MSNNNNNNNSTSSARTNSYGDKQEKVLTEVFHYYLQAGYSYINTTQAFASDRSAYHGFRSFFENATTRTWADAAACMRYQNQRGCTVQLRELSAPKDVSNDYGNHPQHAYQEAIQHSRRIIDHLNTAAAVATESRDAGLQHFVQNCLARETRWLKDLCDIHRMLERSREDKAAIDQLGVCRYYYIFLRTFISFEDI